MWVITLVKKMGLANAVFPVRRDDILVSSVKYVMKDKIAYETLKKLDTYLLSHPRVWFPLALTAVYTIFLHFAD